MKKTLSAIIIGLLCFLMLSMLATQVKLTYALTTLTVNVFDEAGFPPASIHGAYRLPDIPVEIYTLNDILVASGVTDPSGAVTFNLAEGSYKVIYGGKVTGATGGGGFGVASKIVEVSGSSVSVDLHCFGVTYHSYLAGGPYELNYIDLDTSSGGHQDTIIVQPGAQVNAEFSWWELETINVPVWYVSAFGEWSPTSALGNLGLGVASPSSHNLHTVLLTFTVPTIPGTYGVRLVGVLDYDWPNSYYTGDHYQPSLGRDTSMAILSKAIDSSYGIGTIIVSGAPVASVDIDPNTLNLKSRGKWITSYIELSGGFVVGDIDVSSIMLNGTLHAAPKPTSIGDNDNDGIPDLMVKFDRQAIITWLKDEGIYGGEVTFTVTGTVADKPFEGHDTIRIISPQSPHPI